MTSITDNFMALVLNKSFFDNETYSHSKMAAENNHTSPSNASTAASMSVDMYANTYLTDHPTLLILFVTTLSAAAMCGVLGNIMVIYAVMMDKFLRQPANLLVINVAIADIFIAGVLNPFNVAGAVYGYALFARRRWLCLLVGSMCVPVCTSSLYNLALIAVSRWIHICKFKWYANIYTWNKVFFMCISVWCFGFLLNLPNHIGWGRTDYGSLFFICTSDVGVYSYSLLWLTAGILMPFIVVAISYCKIFSTLRQRNLRMHTDNGGGGGSPAASNSSKQIPSTANSTATDIILVQRRPENFVVRDAIISDNNLDTMSASPYHKQSYPTFFPGSASNTRYTQAVKMAKKSKGRAIISQYNSRSRTFKSVQDEIKLIRTLFITVVAFVLGWSLFIVLVLLHTPSWIPGWVYVFSIFLAHIQSAVNPVIYCATNVHFRNVYKLRILASG